ncbi:MAG: CocE/NonD family hydrolase [Gemmatimonadaceae bacterium]
MTRQAVRGTVRIAAQLVALLVALTFASSARAQFSVRHSFGVKIPMRDGVRLAADIWMPSTPGRYPVLVARTPYMRTGLRLADWGNYFASRGYIFVSQNTGNPVATDTTFRRAQQTIAHDRAHPSALVLSVVRSAQAPTGRP